ncbi:MAG: glycosyltransferase family 4 protein, partial [Planctomycetota bacterium]|nr:glycosyltransferase family 4 protein [Planctomycetota bacterium]
EVRAALSEVHRVLRLSENSPLVLYAGPMRESNRVLDLVSAWPKVLEHHPTAKLWLVGQGEQAAEIWTLVRDLGMRDSVIMVGTFDDLSPVLQATDVFVVPEGRGQPSTFTLTAMGAGVPVVAGEGASSASVASRQRNMFTFSEGHVDGLAEALLFVLQSGPVVQDRIRRGIQEVERRNSIELMGQRHIHLLKKCLSR